MKSSVADLKDLKAEKVAKDANQTKHKALLQNSKLSRFDDNIWDSFALGCTVLAPLKDTISKDGILDCRQPPRFATSKGRKELYIFRILTGLYDRQKT